MFLRSIGGIALTLLAAIAVAETPATPVAIGSAAPDFAMTGVDGKEFRLSDITKSGKNVALMFSRAHW